MELLNMAIAGFIGGVVRGLVGIMKDKKTSKRFKMDWARFAFTLISSGVIGILAGIVGGGDLRVSLLSGYAGIDLLESAYKMQVQK